MQAIKMFTIRPVGSCPMTRILIINDGSLLDESVIRLLAARADLDVSSIHFKHESALLMEIASTPPDVIILGQTRQTWLKRLLEFFNGVPGVGPFRIIALHPNKNLLDVNFDQRLSFRSTEEFIAIIRRGRRIKSL
jgi:hypothetical protein